MFGAESDNGIPDTATTFCDAVPDIRRSGRKRAAAGQDMTSRLQSLIFAAAGLRAGPGISSKFAFRQNAKQGRGVSATLQHASVGKPLLHYYIRTRSTCVKTTDACEVNISSMHTSARQEEVDIFSIFLPCYVQNKKLSAVSGCCHAYRPYIVIAHF